MCVCARACVCVCPSQQPWCCLQIWYTITITISSNLHCLLACWKCIFNNYYGTVTHQWIRTGAKRTQVVDEVLKCIHVIRNDIVEWNGGVTAALWTLTHRTHYSQYMYTYRYHISVSSSSSSSSSLQITVQHGSADTVVRAMNAFNGKCRFSGYASSETPWPIFKKWHSWLRRGPHPTRKNWGQSVQMGRVCACVKLSPSGVYFFSFFMFHAHRYRSARWDQSSLLTAQMTRSGGHYVLFMVSLIRKYFFLFLPKNVKNCITPYGNFEQL